MLLGGTIQSGRSEPPLRSGELARLKRVRQAQLLSTQNSGRIHDPIGDTSGLKNDLTEQSGRYHNGDVVDWLR